MAFDLYFAGSQNKECEDYLLNNSCCRLQSQLNDRKNINYWVSKDFGGKLFIDSGAYTAYTKKTKVDVDDYINYINSIDDKLSLFAQVDKIPGNYGEVLTLEHQLEAPKLSWENYLYMRERVKSVDKLLPVFHGGEDFSYLKNMLEYKDHDGKKIQYIGLGALVGVSTTVKEDFFRRVFSIIKKSSNPDVKVHAFGMTSLSLLERYPFTSADSTSWIMTGSAGSIMTPYGIIDVSDKKCFEKTNLRNIEGNNTLEEWFNKNGIDKDKLFKDYKHRMLCNIIYLKQWADNYQFKGNNYVCHDLFSMEGDKNEK